MRNVKNSLLFFFTMLAIFLAGSWFYPNDVPQDDEPYVAVIYGYSYFLKDSSTVGVYVERTLTYLRQSKNLRAIVVSGGVTRPGERPGESEAGLMRAELLARGVAVPIYVEDRALSTGQNARFVLQLLKDRGFGPGTQLLIFGDFSYMPKVVGASFMYVFHLYSVKHIAVDMSSEHVKIARYNAKRPAR